MRLPVDVTKDRYTTYRPKPSAIIASARQELHALQQQSTLPVRSRMSFEGPLR